MALSERSPHHAPKSFGNNQPRFKFTVENGLNTPKCRWNVLNSNTPIVDIINCGFVSDIGNVTQIEISHYFFCSRKLLLSSSVSVTVAAHKPECTLAYYHVND